MTDSIRLYINAAPVEVPPGSSALDAVRLWNPAAADAIDAGARRITDSRGLEAPPDAPAYTGAIFRVVAARARADDEPTV